MKLKLVINGVESPYDFKLLRTTVQTVASLRKTAVLRFTDDKLVIISTPKSLLQSVSSNAVLQSDTGQLWCTIPGDAFKTYTVVSVRSHNAITMECNCDSLLSVFKRYDRCLSAGCSSDMLIRLQSMPEWQSSTGRPSESDRNETAGMSAAKSNPVCVLGIQFEEIVQSGSGAQMEMLLDEGPGSAAHDPRMVVHSFKVPVKLLFHAQDDRIVEPLVNYERLVMYKLPSSHGEFGSAFLGFMKRVERYATVKHIKLSGQRHSDREPEPVPGSNAVSGKGTGALSISVHELDWDLSISWGGPLEAMVQRTAPEPAADSSPGPMPGATGREPTQPRDDSVLVRDALMLDDSDAPRDVSLVSDRSANTSATLARLEDTVLRAEQQAAARNQVMVRCRDWKVCGRLYAAFEDVVMAIAHNESCILHCSLDRGAAPDSPEASQREVGQIIYYMTRSRPL